MKNAKKEVKEVTVKSLKDAEKAMPSINKGLKLIDSTHGKIGIACYAVHEYLKSDTGKAELKEAKLSATAWLTSKLDTTPEAFYNASRRYAKSLSPDKGKDKGKGKGKVSAEKQAISAEFGKVEIAFPEYLKGLNDSQFQTVKAIVDAENIRRESEKSSAVADKANKAA